MKVKVASLTTKNLPERVALLTRRDNPGWNQGRAICPLNLKTVGLVINHQQTYLLARGEEGKKLSFGSGTLVSI